MKPNELELHDAVLSSWTVDARSRGISIRIDAYLSKDAKNRTSVEINFREVESLSSIVDFANLASNSRAGNINYWVPGPVGANSYIYLSDGCIAIRAGQIDVVLMG